MTIYKIHDPTTDRYSTMEYSEILKTINCINKTKESKHHKVITLNELLEAFDFNNITIGDYIHVLIDEYLTATLYPNGICELIYDQKYNKQ